MTNQYSDDQSADGDVPPVSDAANREAAERAVLRTVDGLVHALGSARRAVASLEETRQILAPTLTGDEVKQAWLGCNLFLRDAFQDLHECGMEVGNTLRAMLARD